MVIDLVMCCTSCINKTEKLSSFKKIYVLSKSLVFYNIYIYQRDIALWTHKK